MPETTPGDRDREEEAARAARIESARSDFVGSLARRVQELRTIHGGLEQDPGSPRLRDDLRRRVHALSAGARLLRFASMATALADVERMLERAAAVGELDRSELRTISEVLDRLPSLAWNEPTHEQRPTERPPVMAPIGEAAAVSPSVLVVGSSGLADAITLPLDHPAENDIECERTETTATALELARALVPDVVVLDADLPGARDLVEKLRLEPATESLALVVVGTWATPEEGAAWALGGASRVLAKPVSPHELRMACAELAKGKDEAVSHRPLGETTVENVTALIIDEIKRGLSDAVVVGKTTSIHVGDGTDILAAVWGAVARVRDLLTIKSAGEVRFSSRGPEGALPIAPWLGEGAPGAERGGRGRSDPPRRPEGEVRLEGRKAVVADDDPAVTWFIGGVLRTAGVEVREAHDGDRALELCFRLSPELVISDVLMPGLDGFALCRALKRDISLRDVPVILLSWKEDLLQRLRDLGADADGYMRKEASAAALLRRVSEVLRSRARIESRLAESGEVRGRLDGITPRTLLYTISRVRPDARLGIRDASFLYELEIRDGAPKSATRTTTDGSFQRGKDVFAALLGVRAGRFVVTSADRPVRGTLEGSLDTQLEGPIAHARAALRLLGGTRLLEVQRVTVAMDRVSAYMAATPEPARSLIGRLAHGASPRALILGSEVAPLQLEAVLCDLATHGAVVGVQGAGGDLLGPAFEHELSILRRGDKPSGPPEKERMAELPDFGEPTSAPRSEPNKVIVLEPEPTSSPASSERVEVGPGVALGELVTVGTGDKAAPAARTSFDEAGSPGELIPPSERETLPSATEIGRSQSTPDIDVQEHPAALASEFEEGEEHTPSSLEAAVIREISDRTPVPALSPASADKDPSIVDTRGLRARSLTPSSQASYPPDAVPSLPPDAVIPENPSEDRLSASDVMASFEPDRESARRFEHTPATQGTRLADRIPPRVSIAGPSSSGSGVSAAGPARPVAARANEDAAKEERGGGSFIVGVLVALAAMAVLVFGLRYARGRLGGAGPLPPPDPPFDNEPAFPEPLPVPPASVELPPAASVVSTIEAGSPVPIASVKTAASVSSATPTVGEDLPLPPGVVVTANQGLLDIETGAREPIFVDGRELGKGPVLRLVLAPGVHEIRARIRGEWRTRFVLIRASRRTRLPVAGWTR